MPKYIRRGSSDNLQKKRVRMNGKIQTVYISARALKSGKGLRKANIELV